MVGFKNFSDFVFDREATALQEVPTHVACASARKWATRSDCVRVSVVLLVLVSVYRLSCQCFGPQIALPRLHSTCEYNSWAGLGVAAIDLLFL